MYRVLGKWIFACVMIWGNYNFHISRKFHVVYDCLFFFFPILGLFLWNLKVDTSETRFERADKVPPPPTHTAWPAQYWTCRYFPRQEGRSIRLLPPPSRYLIMKQQPKFSLVSLTRGTSSYRDVRLDVLGMVCVTGDGSSTAMYKADPVVSRERQRSGWSKNLFINGGNTKKQANWKLSRAKDENKHFAHLWFFS